MVLIVKNNAPLYTSRTVRVALLHYFLTVHLVCLTQNTAWICFWANYFGNLYTLYKQNSILLVDLSKYYAIV
jgi:hypothetical protein